MLTKKSNENRNETTMFLCISDFVPKIILRKIDVAVNQFYLRFGGGFVFPRQMASV